MCVHVICCICIYVMIHAILARAIHTIITILARAIHAILTPYTHAILTPYTPSSLARALHAILARSFPTRHPRSCPSRTRSSRPADPTILRMQYYSLEMVRDEKPLSWMYALVGLYVYIFICSRAVCWSCYIHKLQGERGIHCSERDRSHSSSRNNN